VAEGTSVPESLRNFAEQREEYFRHAVAQSRVEDIRTRGQIEAESDKIRHELTEVRELAKERAWSVEQKGITIGEGEKRLMTGGLDADYIAPKAHPVWIEALAHETDTLRRMGEISNRAQPWEEGYQPRADASPTWRRYEEIWERMRTRAEERAEERPQESERDRVLDRSATVIHEDGTVTKGLRISDIQAIGRAAQSRDGGYEYE
jgi:hypothetical protein